ncbi:transglycosylase family protein [Actinomycetospora soli]|uniref:transglycosylase family protein n=1 Tax=Actinomycetospora soli TaxID=2893887 RepID=UPI001E29C9B2|nr:transglycosylase family protein [Actinomycetospora soli]MCD2188681.1 transglycosylase family protein [Actinomycetospora soli]
MSGRHRKPSTLSENLADTTGSLALASLKVGVVAATVTAPVALAGTAMAAPSAEASPQSNATWDRLAKCESTNNWDADTGNGFKGGLQFTDSTWKAFGGKKYADSADEASREEQIAVAKKVQAEQGWKAWPTCTKKLGMR